MNPDETTKSAQEEGASSTLAMLKALPGAKGLGVSLADITNVQLRRMQKPTARRAIAPSLHKAGSPLGFKLRPVAGLERSPGGTPIRSEIAKSSQNNTVDKFALALKKKFEVR